MLNAFQIRILELELSYHARRQDGNNIETLFSFVDEYLEELQRGENLEALLVLLHHVAETEPAAVGAQLVKWLDKYTDNKDNLSIVLNVVFQVLRSFQSSVEVKEHHVIGDMLVKTLYDSCATTTDIEFRIANVLTCLDEYLRCFDNVHVITELRNLLQDEKIVIELKSQIIVYFFDDFQRQDFGFYCNKGLIEITQTLLTSSLRELRKVACYILKKRLEAVPGQKQREMQWTAYITVMENLDENQSHLIMPSLATFAKIVFLEDVWKTWLEILYKRLLSHNNILIIRWTLEDLLERDNQCLTLSLFLDILKALNNTNLYNHEGYFLPDANIKKFLTVQSTEHFLKDLVEVRWKPVPLHFWLVQLENHIKSTGTEQNYSEDLLTKLASRIRMLQCPTIRARVIELIEFVFKDSIAAMSLCEYVIFIETLYNINDMTSRFNDMFQWYPTFMQKLTKAVNFGEQIPTFGRRLYDFISTHEFWTNSDIIDMIYALAKMPKDQHGWFRFLVIFNLRKTPDVLQFCATFYEINIVDFDLMDIMRKATFLKEKLACDREEEKFVLQRITDLYGIDFNRLTDGSIDNLLENGTHPILVHLAKKLLFHQSIDGLDYDRLLNVCNTVALKRLIKKHMHSAHQGLVHDLEDCVEYVRQLLDLDFDNANVTRIVLESSVQLETSTYVRGLLYGEAKCGEMRIEELYMFKQLCIQPVHFRIRSLYRQYLIQSQVKSIVDELLSVHQSYARCRKKVRYFEYCKEHREKLRIATALLNIEEKYGPNSFWNEALWDILLLENNQLNVTYMYEYLVAKLSPNNDDIRKQLDRIYTYTASQQISVICVAHTRILLKMDNASEQSEVEGILYKLLPLTMGANFQTRLYAQLIILNICRRVEWLAGFVPPVRDALGVAIGDVLEDLLEDIRLKIALYDLRQKEHLSYIIMHVTNAPYDEFHTWPPVPGKFQYSSFKISKALFAKKTCSVMKMNALNNIAPPSPPLENPVPMLNGSDEKNQNMLIQRKMNPTNDLIWPNNLSLSPKCKSTDSELIVVASLIDKLPNLGGIARTCEVLGICNLVLDTSSCVDKVEFQNVSKTAEKELNIIEVKAYALNHFLRSKKIEGYKIIGAEQTANSVNFTQFQFPRKAVLLLGHEKEGIPLKLLGFLDYAVEIPQLGIVRSLNVHVTGALFMWEYCKQHLLCNS